MALSKLHILSDILHPIKQSLKYLAKNIIVKVLLAGLYLRNMLGYQLYKHLKPKDQRPSSSQQWTIKHIEVCSYETSTQHSKASLNVLLWNDQVMLQDPSPLL